MNLPIFISGVTLFILVNLGLAIWKRNYLSSLLLLISLVAALVVIIEPLTKTTSYAAKHGEPVSVNTHFFGKQSAPTKFQKDVVYGVVGQTKLKLNVWPAQKHQQSTKKPAMIKIHGGGWVEGNPGNTPVWNRVLSQAGYVVFDIQYRMPPAGNWQSEVADVKAAIGYVQTHSQKYGIDPKKVNLMGDSAGANLAMLAAYSIKEQSLPAATGIKIAPLNTVFNLYGPVDLTDFYYHNTNKTYIQGVLKQYIGGNPQQYPERYRQLSPLNYVDSETPPTITFQGLSDRIVGRKQAMMLDNQLTNHQIPHELYLLPQADHVFDQSANSVNTQFAIAKVLKFLARYN